MLCKMSLNELFGSVLASNPPIVENILKHLNFKNLSVCSCVCKLWNVISQTIKKSRKEMFYTTSVQQFTTSNETESGAVMYKTIVKSSFDVGQAFCDDLDNNFYDSKFGIIFCSRSICSKPQAYFFDFKERSKKIIREIYDSKGHQRWERARTVSVRDFLSSYIPQSCKMVLCSSEGVIGTSKKTKTPYEWENKNNPAICGIFFPDYKGVNFHYFPIDQKMCCTNPPYFLTHIGTTFDEPVKCLLVFTCSNPKRSESVTSLIDYLLVKEEGKIAIGGAVIDDVPYLYKTRRTCRNVAVAITGDNVSASSLILDYDIKTSEQVEEKLKLFKDCVASEGEYCAYMFTCVERGSAFYNQSNVEASIFAKLYPGIPLFGVFCYGEIGVEHLPSQPKPIDGNIHNKWFHSYTSIFVLLSFKIQ